MEMKRVWIIETVNHESGVVSRRPPLDTRDEAIEWLAKNRRPTYWSYVLRQFLVNPDGYYIEVSEANDPDNER